MRLNRMQSRLPKRSYSPTLAAILSLIPGLGHAYVGRQERGLIVAIPWIALIAAGFLVAVFDRHALLFAASSSAWLTNLTVVLIGLLLCHVFVVVDAFRLAGGTLRGITKLSDPARLAGPAMIAILLATTVFYGGAASVTYGGAQALSNIFGAAPVSISDNGTAPPNYSQPPNDTAIYTPPPTASGFATPTGSATPF